MIRFLPVFIVFISTLIGAFGSLYLKRGSETFNRNLFSQIKNFKFLIGVFFYLLSTVIYLFAIRLENVSILYPITSLTYVWVAFLSNKILGEKINKNKIIGISLILLGIITIATQI